MSFSEFERNSLLSVSGIGPTVISRLEQVGLNTFAKLRDANPNDVVLEVSLLVGGSCWRNSPQALNAIKNAINFAKIASNKPLP